MSDSEEKLEDLHRTLLTLCGANTSASDDETDCSSIDETVIEVQKPETKEPEAEEAVCIHIEIADNTFTVGNTSASNSPSKKSEISLSESVNNSPSKKSEISLSESVNNSPSKKSEISLSESVNNSSSKKSEISLSESVNNSPSNISEVSPVETSIDNSQYDTVDEISGSGNDVYATTSEDSSGWSPPKSGHKVERFEVIDETDGDSPNPINRPDVRNVMLAKKEHSISFGMSPIKFSEKDQHCLASVPNTPSFLPGSKFAQSTPMNPKLANINCNDSAKKSGQKGKRSQKKKRSIFEDEDNELSNMSFDELLGDIMNSCQDDGTDWKSIFRDTSSALKDGKSIIGNECENKRKAVLKDWEMLYARNELKDDAQKNVTQGELIEIEETKLEETLVNTRKDNGDEMYDIPPEAVSYLTPMDDIPPEAEDDLKTILSQPGNISKAVSPETVPPLGDENVPSTSGMQNLNKSESSVNDQNGMKSESKSHDHCLPSTSKAPDHNLSKIKIESFFTDNDKESKDQISQKGNGRFSNYQSFILSDIETTEDENEAGESEDLLGLNNFTYSEADEIDIDDIDDEDEATLLDDTITDLPESIRNKYKIYEEVTIVKEEKKSATEDQEKVAGTDVNENLTKTTVTTSEQEPLNKKREDIVTVVISSDDEVKIEEEDKMTDISKVTGKIDYKAERQYFKIESAEVQDIIHQWDSKGIQDPDMNLSHATNLHRKKGVQGMLEGNHISCIWLRESVEAGKECSSPMKKRQRLDSEALNRQDVMRLEEELNEINCRYQTSLRVLWQEWMFERDSLEGRHKPVFNKLRCGQLMEMKENYERYRFTNIDMFKMNVMRLHMEHDQQKMACRHRFNEDLNRLKHLFQRREVDIDRNFNHRKNQLISLIEQMKHVKSDGKYGHHVTAQFVKGPCRSNKLTRSLVEVYVPAEVASCILREDEVVDSFYKYV